MAEPDNSCPVQIDLDVRCGKPATRVVHEPYTPKAFAIECCDNCAEDLIAFGYFEASKPVSFPVKAPALCSERL